MEKEKEKEIVDYFKIEEVEGIGGMPICKSGRGGQFITFPYGEGDIFPGTERVKTLCMIARGEKKEVGDFLEVRKYTYRENYEVLRYPVIRMEKDFGILGEPTV